jgi:hypothetical protein
LVRVKLINRVNSAMSDALQTAVATAAIAAFEARAEAAVASANERAAAAEARAAEATAAAEARAAEAMAAAEARAAEAMAVVVARAAEATAAADARADAAAVDLIGEAKAHFLTRMKSVSCSNSKDTPSGSDKRRGALEPDFGAVPVDVLEKCPEASAVDITKRYGDFAKRIASMRFTAPGAKLEEVRDVHPVLNALLASAASHSLRVWRERVATDDVTVAEMRPDFTLTHCRDAAPSTIGALVIVEAKLPGNLASAVKQVAAYLRRRVFKLCLERSSRGEPFADVFSLGVGTDGREIVFVRVRSGAPELGGVLYKTAVPCPVDMSQRLPLLSAWDFCEPLPDFKHLAPPAGYAALVRLLGAPHDKLGFGAPLASLTAAVHWGCSADGGDGSEREVVVLELSNRLGSGGSSDVYAIANACTEHGGTSIPFAAAAAAGTVVAKIARVATPHIHDCFSVELDALVRLTSAAREERVPTLVGSGVYALDAAWRLLLLRPRGVPLADWVSMRAASSGSGGVRTRSGNEAAASAHRRAVATAVITRVLETLRCAHDAGLMHCDVRPSNVVIFKERAVLVDWGLSCAASTAISCRGVAAFSDERVFQQGSYSARPAADIAGALFSWLAIVFDGACGAPWIVPPFAATDAEMFEDRRDWLGARSGSDVRVGRIVSALSDLDRAGGIDRALAAIADSGDG